MSSKMRSLLGMVCLCAIGSIALGERAPVQISVTDGAARDGVCKRDGHIHSPWCAHRAHPPLEVALAQVNRVAFRGAPVAEVEPNDAAGSGQFLNLGTGGGESQTISVEGSLSGGADVDEYRFNLRAGDILGVATLWRNGGEPDTVAALHDWNGTFLHENDQGSAAFFFTPPDSPLPRIANSSNESALQFIAPVDGEYRIRVRAFQQASSGDYLANFGVYRQPYESNGEKQVLFVDFDGATIDAVALFGDGNNPAVLSPLSAFLGNWGLSAGDESAVIDAVMAGVQARLDFVASLNPNFGYELLNSRDHADPFGDPNVSRLIVGGTIAESGISTIGIAEWIDPGNFSNDDTAIILLDLLSSTGSGVAVQDLPRDPGFTLIEAIGRVVGNITAHEAGHYLGGWHTENDNLVPNIMDAGGGNSFVLSIPGLGNDGIMGTADDNPTEFGIDNFIEPSSSNVGIELIDQRMATALSMTVASCDGDANGDGTVDVNDISYVLFRLGDACPPCEGDANGDNTIDVNDISYVLFRLGPC